MTEAGRPDLAYKMLENEDCPGWLYQVKQGATTIWETWEGYTDNVNSGSMNHYSPGAVCGWLFDTACGIRPAGEHHFILAPQPGGSLTYAQAEYKSLYGTVSAAWEKQGGAVVYRFTVPANCTAEIKLPGGKSVSVSAGSYQF